MRKRWWLSPAFTVASIMLAALLLAVSCSRHPQGAVRTYAMGETADLEGWRVTVESFSMLAPDAAFQPEAGNVLCSVELTLENASERIRFMMPEKQMRLVTGGRTYFLDQNAAVMSARLRQWMVPEGEMDPESSAHGAASYQIPAGSGDVQWTLYAGLFPWSPSVTFVLGRPS